MFNFCNLDFKTSIQVIVITLQIMYPGFTMELLIPVWLKKFAYILIIYVGHATLSYPTRFGVDLCARHKCW